MKSVLELPDRACNGRDLPQVEDHQFMFMPGGTLTGMGKSTHRSQKNINLGPLLVYRRDTSGGSGRVRQSNKRRVNREGGPLTDVLEEGAGQHRQAKFDVENDEEYAQKATPDPHFEKLAGVSDNRRREQKRRGHGNQALANATSSHCLRQISKVAGGNQLVVQ